jgi:hypothetical protein
MKWIAFSTKNHTIWGIGDSAVTAIRDAETEIAQYYISSFVYRRIDNAPSFWTLELMGNGDQKPHVLYTVEATDELIEAVKTVGLRADQWAVIDGIAQLKET